MVRPPLEYGNAIFHWNSTSNNKEKVYPGLSKTKYCLENYIISKNCFQKRYEIIQQVLGGKAREGNTHTKAGNIKIEAYSQKKRQILLLVKENDWNS